MNNWQVAIYIAIGLFIGVILHEYMHGRVADWCGDHTARGAGRITLNPIPHIDPFGTVLLPLALLLISGGRFAFGYAKPVPVNPYFMRKRRDMIYVALAGPLTNFAVALAIALIGMIVHLAGVSTVSGLQISELFMLFYFAAFINVWLGVFNLIPVPPLDGSHVLEYFLPPRAQETYEKIAPFGFIVVFVFFLLAGNMFLKLLNPVFVLIARIMGIPSFLV
ncbi:MAG: site-2 protease family protein [Candidatus Geothermincolia bacterium]